MTTLCGSRDDMTLKKTRQRITLCREKPPRTPRPPPPPNPIPTPPAREALEGVASRYSADDHAMWQSRRYDVEEDKTKDHTLQRCLILPPPLPCARSIRGVASRCSANDLALSQSRGYGVHEDKIKDHTLQRYPLPRENRLEVTVPDG